MNVYIISYNGKIHYVSASSRKSAMLKYFGVERVDGAEIRKANHAEQ